MSFSPRTGYIDLPVKLACGSCIGCRLDRSQAWAVRVVHEAQFHPVNVFVTLTYRPKSLPPGGTLVKKDVQDFLKRLRKWHGGRLSYFMCGEYGEQLSRPHYHLILFGVDFTDKTPWKKSSQGDQLYVSATLERLWGHGFTSVGDCTFQSAAYCARYVMKKITGDMAVDHYTRIDPDTGEVHQLQPEYLAASLRPAIGKRWIEKYSTDVYPSDSCVVEGRERRVPRYYDKRLAEASPEVYSKVRDARMRRAGRLKARANAAPERLAVREEVAHAKLLLLKRGLG
ncbi:MAG: hypothetical protein OEV65_16655 [Aquincola sp.]|nr:hypothetical protein [Aquincola sp.]